VWLLRLIKEYESILYGYGIKGLKPANLRLSEGTMTLGTWNHETRTIAISRPLISSAPWEVVCQVLRHEMAHQIADELLGGDEGHGSRFLAACQMIWVEPWARNPKVEMGEDFTEDRLKSLDWAKFTSPTQDAEMEKLKERLKKLLALSESSNPHEASIALSKAMKLQQERLISPTDWNQEFETRIIRPKKKRLERHYAKIGAILSNHYQVRIIYCKEFDASTLESFQTMEILGPSQSVELAEHVYFFLLQTLETQFRVEQKKSLSALNRKSYFDGILAGVSEQLSTQAKGMTIPPSAKALAIQSDTLLREYYAKRHPRVTNRSISGSTRDGGSYEKGKQKGRDLHIRPPVKSPLTLYIGRKGGF
jgi:hypothetical protein